MLCIRFLTSPASAGLRLSVLLASSPSAVGKSIDLLDRVDLRRLLKCSEGIALDESNGVLTLW